MTLFAAVRFNPTPPTWVVTSNIEISLSKF